MIQHVMLFWFRADADARTVASFLDGIAAFATTVPSVEHVAMSANRGDAARSAPYTHGAILTFTDIQARDAFFVHETHVSVRERAMTVFGHLLTLSVES